MRRVAAGVRELNALGQLREGAVGDASGDQDAVECRVRSSQVRCRLGSVAGEQQLVFERVLAQLKLDAVLFEVGRRVRSVFSERADRDERLLNRDLPFCCSRG